jgi:hypothetical protein
LGSFLFGKNMSTNSYDENYTKYKRTPNVEELDGHEGVAENEDLFALSLSDEEITKTLNNRINNSRVFWNDSANFDLRRRRERNQRFVVGDHWYDVPIVGQHIPYVQNEVFTAEQVISAYVTAKLPELETYPGQDTPESRRLAQNVAAMLRHHSDTHDLQGILCNIVLSMLNNYVGIIELEWDPNCGPYGDIVPHYKDPANMIIDKRAKQGKNPNHICDTKQNTADELVAQFPKAKQAIMDKVNDNGSAVITWRYAWCTYYENGKPQEGFVAYFEDVVMAKNKNPHWIYDEGTEGVTNVLPYPTKPYIPFNYINDGDHWIDRYGPIDQAIPVQLMIDSIGKQIQQNIRHASPVLILNKDAISKPKADKITGAPWEKILVDAQDVRTAYGVIQANQVPAYVVNEMERLVQTLHKVFGTPPQLQGESNNSQTATQDLMARNQAQGRQDLLVRAIDRGLDRYFNYLLQMMKVYYTEDHYASVLGEDGRYDFVAMNRNKIEDGLKVTVKSGSTLPMDKSRMESVALNLAKMNKISLLSLYEFLDVPNPGKHVERLIKEQVDAVTVVEDIRNDDQDANAVEDWEMIKAGEMAQPRDDVDQHHLSTHQRQLLSNDFQAQPPQVQDGLRQHVQLEVEKAKLLHGITNDQLYPPQPAPPDVSVPVSVNPQAGGQPPIPTPPSVPEAPAPPQPMAPAAIPAV